jgi:hypothetical protein
MDRSGPFGRSCFGKAEGELNLPLAAFHEGHRSHGSPASRDGKRVPKADTPIGWTMTRARRRAEPLCQRVWALAEAFQFWRGIMRLKTSSAQKDVR